MQFRHHLIFCSDFVHCLPNIWGRITHLMQVLSYADLSWCHLLVFAILLAMFCFFLCSGLFKCINLAKLILFCGVREGFYQFCCSGWCLLFWTVKSVVESICVRSFCFFRVFFHDCVNLRFWYIPMQDFCKPCQPKFMLIILSVGFFCTPKVSLIFCNCRALQNIVLRAYLCIFFCCYAFPLA